MYEFTTPAPITASVRVRSGEAVLIAEERDTTTVEVVPDGSSDLSREAAARTVVEMRGNTLSVESPEPAGSWGWRRGGSVRIHVRVPLDSTAVLNLASADGSVLGRWREAAGRSASGDLEVAEVTGDVNLQTASGDVEIIRVGGDIRAATASGDITVGAVDGDASVRSASGRIRIDDAGGSLSARTASGDVTVGRMVRGKLTAHTASGDVRIGVAPGTRVYFDVTSLSGDTTSDLAAGQPPTDQRADLRLNIRTVSGDIDIVRADEKAAA